MTKKLDQIKLNPLLLLLLLLTDGVELVASWKILSIDWTICV